MEQDRLKKLYHSILGMHQNGGFDEGKIRQLLALYSSPTYGLQWSGKDEARHRAFADIHKKLHFHEEHSFLAEETPNIFIEGDNLDALKLLAHNYTKKIKYLCFIPGDGPLN